MKAENKLKLKVNKNKVQDKIDKLEQETRVYRSKRTKKASKVGKIVAALVLCLVFLFCIFNINYLTPSKMKEHMSAVFAHMGKGDGFPYRFSSNEVLNFSEFNSNDFVILTNSELIILNRTAKPVLKYSHSMSNPIMKCSADRILLYDQGSTKAVVLNQSGQVLAFPNDNKIICGDVSNSGKVVLAFYDENRSQFINVYSSVGKKIMNWKKGSGYIIDTTLNPGGNLVSVGLIDTVDAVKTVSVLSFTVSNAAQKGHIQLKEASLYDIHYLNNNDLAVLCSNAISVLNSKCKEKYRAELPSLSNKQLFCDNAGHIVNVYSLFNNGEYMVDTYNAALKKVDSEKCSGEVTSVTSNGSSLCILFENHQAQLNMIGGKIDYRVNLKTDFKFALARGRMIYTCTSGYVARDKAVKQ